MRTGLSALIAVPVLALAGCASAAGATAHPSAITVMEDSTVKVHLAAPLGTRAVIDAATGDPLRA
ncbi:hypothetical protein [Streptacidiphilus cavernicola]|uniref:Uncharacterized protein n=1 Tax=Streptacidiphilus cavernicola TaxID=3342716 RepID=A0ABV6VT54_9ACTN